MTQDERRARPGWEAAAVLGLTALVAALRVLVLFRSRFDLYPDEAQYWLWSRTLAFGYFSKPPMVAWAIRATTALGGDAEPWVRLSAPLFHAVAGLAVYALGRRLYGARTGLAAAALYALCPAVQLSGLVAATDAPLLCFAGLALAAYAALQSAHGRSKLLAAGGFGAAAGLAFLSKYAAAYLLAGVALHLLLSPQARRPWTPGAALTALGAALMLAAPNLAWNAAHGFATVQHTAANAHWAGGPRFSLAGLGRFLGEQVLIFGPVPAGVLAVGAALALRRRKLAAPDLMLACFIVPPLLVVALQAFVSRANANWAAVAFLPGVVLAAAWLLRWRARAWLAAALALQALWAAAFLVLAASPAAAEAIHVANSFKRVRGWSETARLVVERARRERAGGGLSAVATDNRAFFYALAYYGRGVFDAPGGPPLRAWLPQGRPQNQAELAVPLTAAYGRRVLVASYEGWRAKDVAADFRRVGGAEAATVRLDARHVRRILLFVGEDLEPRPRS